MLFVVFGFFRLVVLDSLFVVLVGLGLVSLYGCACVVSIICFVCSVLFCPGLCVMLVGMPVCLFGLVCVFVCAKVLFLCSFVGWFVLLVCILICLFGVSVSSWSVC